MQLHELKRKTPQKDAKRVGRGGARGKTSGRGTKGQKARAGHRIRPDIREIIKKLPKQRGRGIHGLHSYKEQPVVVNVALLEKFFTAGDVVTPQVLLERKLIRVRKGAAPFVKVLGEGVLSKKFTVTDCAVSASAKEKIEKAGGSVPAPR
jgi:large subunit ribosomal protein L15